MPRGGGGGGGGRGSFGGGWSKSRSSGGWSSSRSTGSGARIKPPHNLPQKVVPAAVPTPSKTEHEKKRDNDRTMVNSFAETYTWIRANRAVRSIFGDPHYVSPETVAAPAYAQSASSNGACAEQANAFQECLNSYGGSDSEIRNVSKCHLFMEKLHQCQSGSASA